MRQQINGAIHRVNRCKFKRRNIAAAVFCWAALCVSLANAQTESLRPWETAPVVEDPASDSISKAYSKRSYIRQPSTLWNPEILTESLSELVCPPPSPSPLPFRFASDSTSCKTALADLTLPQTASQSLPHSSASDLSLSELAVSGAGTPDMLDRKSVV